MRDAIDWMLPYIEGTKTHQEFVHTKVAFDRERAARGIAGFKGPFDPAKAIDLMRFACHFDNFYRPVMDRLLARTDKTGSRGLKMLLPEAA